MNAKKLQLTKEEWNKIGENLREIREQKDLTQEDVAAESTITASYYARIERGEEKPTVATLKFIFKALKVKSSDILPF